MRKNFGTSQVVGAGNTTTLQKNSGAGMTMLDKDSSILLKTTMVRINSQIGINMKKASKLFKESKESMFLIFFIIYMKKIPREGDSHIHI